MSRLVLPALPLPARVRLWLSYQRYGFLLVGGAAAAVAAAIVAAPLWIAIPVALIALWPVGFGAQVLARWPKKLRATRVAMHRIAAGRFAPSQVRGHCGDPCFRVVADEILVRAGVPRGERRALIARYRDELGQRDVLMMVDHTTGVVVTVGADGQFRRESLADPGAEERH